MILSFVDELARATDRIPFSNGTEWDCWSPAWCGRCDHDAGKNLEAGEGCPLILVSLSGKTPAAWEADQPGTLHKPYRCTEFAAGLELPGVGA